MYDRMMVASSAILQQARIAQLPMQYLARTLLKRTDRREGPLGLAVISLQKVDSLLFFLNMVGS